MADETGVAGFDSGCSVLLKAASRAALTFRRAGVSTISCSSARDASSGAALLGVCNRGVREVLVNNARRRKVNKP